MKKTGKASMLFVVVCFLAFLFLMLGISVFKDKDTYSYYENRSLAVMPDLSADTLLSGTWGSGTEKYLSDHAAGRTSFLKADTFINCNVLRQPLVNEVVVTDDCLLPEITDAMESTDSIPQDTQAITANLQSVSTLVSGYGGSYYYVAVPCQYVFHQDDYPWYMNNRAAYTQQSIAALKTSLAQADVNFIDMGEVFAQYGWADYLTSSVDNHYSIYGAYLTYREIMDRINADTGLGLTVLEDGDYTIQQLPNRYLGSRVRKLLGLWKSDEKLSILLPNLEIPFTRWDDGTESASSVYSLPQTQQEDVLYTLYMGGDCASTKIDTGRSDLPSLLVYGDSFTNAAECILYYGFGTMYSLDMRYYKDMSLGQFIDEYQPDVVVCIRDYEALLSTEYNGCGAQP